MEIRVIIPPKLTVSYVLTELSVFICGFYFLFKVKVADNSGNWKSQVKRFVFSPLSEGG